MTLIIFAIFSIVTIIYALFAFSYNFINALILVLIVLFLVITYLLTQTFAYKVPLDKFRLFALIGSMTTSFSLLINATVFIRNEDTARKQNMINFNKVSSDIFNQIDNRFFEYKDKLGYLYQNIFKSIGHKQEQDDIKLRDKHYEFQQALNIFHGLDYIYTAGSLKENKDKMEFRGIMNIFDTYASSPLMQDYWKTQQFSFSPDFIHFMEENFFTKRLSTNKVFV
jgi:hypothetical protein